MLLPKTAGWYPMMNLMHPNPNLANSLRSRMPNNWHPRFVEVWTCFTQCQALSIPVAVRSLKRISCHRTHCGPGSRVTVDTGPTVTSLGPNKDNR